MTVICDFKVSAGRDVQSGELVRLEGRGGPLLAFVIEPGPDTAWQIIGLSAQGDIDAFRNFYARLRHVTNFGRDWVIEVINAADQYPTKSNWSAQPGDLVIDGENVLLAYAYHDGFGDLHYFDLRTFVTAYVENTSRVAVVKSWKIWARPDHRTSPGMSVLYSSVK